MNEDLMRRLTRFVWIELGQNRWLAEAASKNKDMMRQRHETRITLLRDMFDVAFGTATPTEALLKRALEFLDEIEPIGGEG